MILYFADRYMNILGLASTDLPSGHRIYNDQKTEEISAGSVTLEFSLTYTDETRKEIERFSAAGNYIIRKDGESEEFYTIIDNEHDILKHEISVYAEDNGMDLLNETVGAFEANTAYPAKWYVEKYAYDSGFEIGINEVSDLSRKLKWEGEATSAERLLSVATQFGAELSYSFDIHNLSIRHKYINLYRKRGKDVGAKLRLGKEIDNITIKKSVADLATALRVTGGTPQGSNNAITLSGYNYDDGDIYVSGDYLMSRSALAAWSRYLSETGNDVGHIVKLWSYDTTSQSELFHRAVSHLKSIYDVAITCEVELAYLPDGVSVGDTVDIVDEKGELYLSARLVKLVTSRTNKEYTATFGDYATQSSGISTKVQELAAKFSELAKTRTLYTWIAYADDESGTGISTNPDGKSYMGTAPNRTTEEVDTSDTTVFSWSKTKGDDGYSPTVSVADGETGNTVITVDDASGTTSTELKDQTARTDAEEGKKVATNYISGKDGDVVVGDLTAETLGRNVRIANDKIAIRNGEENLASFDESSIDLGISAESARINMCGNRLSIIANANEYGDVAYMRCEDLRITPGMPGAPGWTSAPLFRMSSKDGFGFANVRPWQIIDGDAYPFLTTYELPFMAKPGSTVVRINGTSSVKLFTLADLNSMFGQAYTSAYNYHIFAMNGDGNASAAHLDGVTVIGTDYYVVLDRSVNGSFRVNWMAFCAVSNA